MAARTGEVDSLANSSIDDVGQGGVSKDLMGIASGGLAEAWSDKDLFQRMAWLVSDSVDDAKPRERRHAYPGEASHQTARRDGSLRAIHHIVRQTRQERRTESGPFMQRLPVPQPFPSRST